MGKERQYIISYMTLRKTVGWLGISLPFALLIGNSLLSWLTDFEIGCNPIKSSISHYYYTRMGEIFGGTLCAVSLFLFCYKGYEKIDSRSSNIAGIFCLGVVLFPTSSTNAIPCNLRGYVADSLTGTIHLSCASLFFITLAYMSYFLFTKTGGVMTPQKIKRNFIYRTCAIVIIASIAILALYVFVLEDKFPALVPYHIVFWFEALALIAFGISWLTKGEFLLKDE